MSDISDTAEITEYHAHVYYDPATREVAGVVREGRLPQRFRRCGWGVGMTSRSGRIRRRCTSSPLRRSGWRRCCRGCC